MIVKILLPIAALAALASCASAPTIAELAQTCQNYGFQPGTDSLAHCVQAEWHSYKADKAATAAAWQRAAAAIQQQTQSTMPGAVNCYSNGMGAVTCR